MMDEMKKTYQIKFEELLASFDENDSILVEDAALEMHEHWREYIDAGCDVEGICKMMLSVDVFNNYDYLISKGETIDLRNLADGICLAPDIDGDKFFKDHYLWFLMHGLPADDLPNYILDPDERWDLIVNNFDEIKNLLDKKTISTILLDCCGQMKSEFGAKYEAGEHLYDLFREAELSMVPLAEHCIKYGIDPDCDDMDFWMNFCDTISEEGASNDLIKQLLRLLVRFDAYMFNKKVFINKKVDWLKKYDDDLEYYIKIVVKEETQCASEFCKKSDYPEEVRLLFLKEYINEMSIEEFDQELLESFGAFEKFIEETGLDGNFIVDKFLREDGYDNCCDDWLPFELFLFAPDRLDPEKVVQKSVEHYKRFPDEETTRKDCDALKKAGVDEKIIAPLLELIKD